MINESDVIKALKDLSNENTLKIVSEGLQRNHSQKHLEVTHVRQNTLSYGASFFMKRKPLTQTVTKLVWGKPSTERIAIPGKFSEEFGDYIDINRKDVAIIHHLCDSDSVAYALDTQNWNRFLLFSDVPSPYVGFDWLANMRLPIQAGYLVMVIEKSLITWKIITVFPCARAYYQKHKTKVLHLR